MADQDLAPATSEQTLATADPKKKDRLEQTVTIEDVGPARKCLTIEVPAQRIADKLKEGYSKLKTDAQIPGFRRGRAPMRLIERRFNDSIQDEVRGQVISESYTQAVEDHKLEVLGEPEVKDADKIRLPETGPLMLKVEIEVTPSFALPSLENIPVKKTKSEVTDQQVDEEIDRLQHRFGNMTPAENAVAAASDWLVAEVRVVAGQDAGVDAPEIAHQPGAYVLVTGADRNYRGQVAGIIVEDLGKRLEGKKAGDQVVISLTGPTGHEDERIKDKPITLHLRIDRIERLAPAPLDKLAPQLGLENTAQLKERIRKMLEEQHAGQQKQAMHDAICKHLLESINFDLPEGMSRRQTARILHRSAMEMAMRGESERDIEQKIAELRAGTEQEARRQLKLFFVLDKASKSLEIEITEAEVNGAIAMIAMQQGRRPEKVRQQMIRNSQIEQVYLQVRDRKTLDKILEKAKVVEVEEQK